MPLISLLLAATAAAAAARVPAGSAQPTLVFCVYPISSSGLPTDRAVLLSVVSVITENGKTGRLVGWTRFFMYTLTGARVALRHQAFCIIIALLYWYTGTYVAAALRIIPGTSNPMVPLGRCNFTIQQ